jgi:hypothetical protein
VAGYVQPRVLSTYCTINAINDYRLNCWKTTWLFDTSIASAFSQSLVLITFQLTHSLSFSDSHVQSFIPAVSLILWLIHSLVHSPINPFNHTWNCPVTYPLGHTLTFTPYTSTLIYFDLQTQPISRVHKFTHIHSVTHIPMTLTHRIISHPSIHPSIYPSIHPSIYGSTALRWTLASFSVPSSFTQSAGLLGRGISLSQSLYLHKQNKRTQTSMPQIGFQLTTPVFKQAKTVHALDCAATVIGIHTPKLIK